MKERVKLYEATEFENIRDVMNNAINLYPDNKAFIIKNKDGKNISYTDITYKKFGEDINALGTALINLGLKGKRIAVIGNNSYEWILSYVSTVDGVGIIVPLDKGLPEHEIEMSLVRSKADAIIFEEKKIEEMTRLKEKGSTNIKQFICMKKNKEGYTTLEELLEKGNKLLKEGNREYLDAEIKSDEMSIILFTSGTTSASKCVMLSHRNIASNIYALSLSEKILSTDINMAFLPFHHTFGSTGILLFLSKGVTNVFCDGLRYIADNMKEYKVSVFVGVPLLIESMYKKIMKEIEKQGKTKIVKIGIVISKILLKFGIDIRKKLFKEIYDNLGGNIRFVISGASGIDKNVLKGFNDFGILTLQGYGLTETSPVLIAETIEAQKDGSIGLPLANVQIRIDNPNEEGIGEIVAKGPNVMLGYYENEEETNKVLKDGWFYTGDLAYMDKDGFIFVTGRKKNVIVLKNGKNIYPEELELLINNLPYVAESMVFGKEKDDDLVVSAKIVYDKEYMDEYYPDKSEDEIKEIIWNDIKEINKKLTNFKHIKNIIVTDKEMIKTTTAKVKRFEEIKKIEE